MPFGFVAAAVGATTFAAAAAAATVVGALEVVAAVGAVLSVVGMVTKNKTLSLIGAGLGVVGGFGALAAGALGVGNAALFAGDAASVGEDTLAVSAAGSEAASGGVEGGAFTADLGATAGAEASAAVPDAVAALSGAVPQGAELAAEDAAAVQGNVQAAQVTGTNEVGLSTTADASAAAPAPDVSATATLTKAGPANPELGGSTAFGNNTAIPTPNVTPGETPGLFGGLFDKGGALGNVAAFADAHPAIAFGAVQAGGSLLTSAFSSLTPAQVADLQAKANANDAAAALTKQQTANLAAPKAQASLAPVTGTPATLVPGAGGFINQPRQPAVTGVPA